MRQESYEITERSYDGVKLSIKEKNLNYTDRITVWIKTPSEELCSANAANADYIRGETLAEELIIQGEVPNVQTYQVQIGGYPAQLQVQKKDSATDPH